jgi:hypothetical protein
MGKICGANQLLWIGVHPRQNYPVQVSQGLVFEEKTRQRSSANPKPPEEEGPAPTADRSQALSFTTHTNTPYPSTPHRHRFLQSAQQFHDTISTPAIAPLSRANGSLAPLHASTGPNRPSTDLQRRARGMIVVPPACL